VEIQASEPISAVALRVAPPDGYRVVGDMTFDAASRVPAAARNYVRG
jgi:hypothetical protein